MESSLVGDSSKDSKERSSQGDSGARRLRKGQPAESIIKYKQNTVKHNSVNDFIRV